jgi:hypothetical protein
MTIKKLERTVQYDIEDIKMEYGLSSPPTNREIMEKINEIIEVVNVLDSYNKEERGKDD